MIVILFLIHLIIAAYAGNVSANISRSEGIGSDGRGYPANTSVSGSVSGPNGNSNGIQIIVTDSNGNVITTMNGTVRAEEKKILNVASAVAGNGKSPRLCKLPVNIPTGKQRRRRQAKAHQKNNFEVTVKDNEASNKDFKIIIERKERGNEATTIKEKPILPPKKPMSNK